MEYKGHKNATRAMKLNYENCVNTLQEYCDNNAITIKRGNEICDFENAFIAFILDDNVLYSVNSHCKIKFDQNDKPNNNVHMLALFKYFFPEYTMKTAEPENTKNGDDELKNKFSNVLGAIKKCLQLNELSEYDKARNHFLVTASLSWIKELSYPLKYFFTYNERLYLRRDSKIDLMNPYSFSASFDLKPDFVNFHSRPIRVFLDALYDHVEKYNQSFPNFVNMSSALLYYNNQLLVIRYVCELSHFEIDNVGVECTIPITRFIGIPQQTVKTINTDSLKRFIKSLCDTNIKTLNQLFDLFACLIIERKSSEYLWLVESDSESLKELFAFLDGVLNNRLVSTDYLGIIISQKNSALIQLQQACGKLGYFSLKSDLRFPRLHTRFRDLIQGRPVQSADDPQRDNCFASNMTFIYGTNEYHATANALKGIPVKILDMKAMYINGPARSQSELYSVFMFFVLNALRRTSELMLESTCALTESSSYTPQFLSECCMECEKDKSTSAEDVFSVYKAYMQKEHYPALGKTKLMREIVEIKGLEYKSVRSLENKKAVFGLAIKPSVDIPAITKLTQGDFFDLYLDECLTVFDDPCIQSYFK